MNTYTALPLAALPVLVILPVIVLLSKRIPARPFLLVYLLSSAVWALGSLALHSDYFADQSAALAWFVPVAGAWAVVAFSQFTCAVARRRVVTWVVLGYALVAALAVIAARGYAAQVAAGAEGTAGVFQGSARYVLMAGAGWFAALPVLYLVQMHRGSTDAQTGNRAAYLAVGALLAGVSSVGVAAPSLLEYPVEHLGHAGNAVLVTYVLGARDIADFRIAARRALIFLSASLLVAPLYLLSFLGLHYFSASWKAPATIVAAVGILFILPWLLIGLRGPVQRKVDRALYRDRLSHRQAVFTFPRRMGNVLSLTQLAEGMLQDIPKAVNASYVSLLLAANGDFAAACSNQLNASDAVPQVMLSNRSPIVSWLAANDRPLSCESIDADSGLDGLSGEERDAIRALGISLFVPLNSQGRLVGILAVGRKQGGRPYSSDDVDLLATVGTESATALANAQLYAQTKERAHIDELTGLLNHGYFHQRLEEEISRCSRFGSVLSLIFLDVDLFKSYNDAFGHLAGDDVLRQIASHIKDSIRGVDLAFRYGGDEFAVVLPESSLDDACHVAERIRKRIEREMESKGIALTCSMGVAAWPTDGVAREMVLRAADSALYLSKQKGRNQISLASEAAAAHSNGSDSAHESEILSAVHALAATVDAKDTNTYGHSKKTSEYALYVAQALGFPAEKLTEVKASALLHDIGKIRVPDIILVKPGRLTDEEWLAIREHPKFGVAILKHITGLSGCLPAIQHHHERFDGTGYPAGLVGSDIPLSARILAVADAYDAMTSPRPYRREKMSHQQAVDELARCAGKQFDPEIVRAFERLWEPLDSCVTALGVARLSRRTIVPGAKALLLPRVTRAR